MTLPMPLPDLVALGLFVLLWLGYGPAQGRIGPRTINARLHSVRIRWMRSMLLRDNRIADSSLIGHVVHSASFFASTSLIAIGALLGVLTGLDRLQIALDGLAFGAASPRGMLEYKVLLPLAVLVHGLFKLTWALRQLNYTVALIGAMPSAVPAEPLRGQLAARLGGVLSSALSTFNDGIRSYYFALAGMTWLAGPWALMVAAVGLVGLLVHRQITSGVALQFAAAEELVLAAHAPSPEAARDDMRGTS
jgi:uncharacterized membrane protein